MREDTFKLGLRTLCAQLPYGKTPKEDELCFLWSVIPKSVTGQVTDGMWLYAVQQRLIDPAPDDKLPIFQQVLRHLYRLRDGMPEFAWGLREDLSERMASAERFHPLTPANTAAKRAALPPFRQKAPETKEQRRARIMALAAATGLDLSKPYEPKSDEPQA
jgi:hypothetical protein